MSSAVLGLEDGAFFMENRLVLTASPAAKSFSTPRCQGIKRSSLIHLIGGK